MGLPRIAEFTTLDTNLRFGSNSG